ncbi:uncharacterized protein ColSpa_11374 [Colletotrichum spaethianum]|uniref:Uncharacterized protein n=1 Tax=Colletotrichum spaethianum TaxID=700344 RepID=A0AA37PFE3_9PEZI|nr:uncharacterized protein ColSpa_11374 [Colletotrichum spaethianum]GKT51193.1 hypothetical protein ColSpa_11374 [Colletotrichum spaethianum]
MDEERYVSMLAPRKPEVVSAASALVVEWMRQNPLPPINYQNLYRTSSSDLPKARKPGSEWSE